MAFINQSLQLARLDLVRSRWFIAAFVCVIMANALIVFSTRGALSDDSGIAVLSVIPSLIGTLGAAVLLIGSIIQNDSPSDADAYWRVAPVDTATLVASKMFVIALTVMLPLAAAQIIALWTLPVTQPEKAATFLPAIGGMIAILLTPPVIAALTPTFRSYILTVLGVFAASTYLENASFLRSFVAELRATPHIAGVTAAGTLIVVGWLISLYWTRRSVIASRVLSVAVLLIVPYLPMLGLALIQKVRTQPPDGQSPAPTDVRAMVSGSSVVVSFSVPAPDRSHRLFVVNPVVTLNKSGAKPLTLMPRFFMRSYHNSTFDRLKISRNETPLDSSGAVVTPDSAQSGKFLRVELNFALPDAALLPALHDSLTSFVFNGFVETQSLDTIITFPADTGHVFVRKAWYFKTSLEARDDSGSQLRIAAWSLTPSTGATPNIFDLSGAPPEFYRLRAQGYTIAPFVTSRSEQLVARATGDSIVLISAGGHSTGLPLPMATTVFYNAVRKYHVNGNPAASISIDDLRRSQFAITRWAYAYHRPIHATTRLR